MNTAAEIHDLALKLPHRSRLKLAGELLRSVAPETSSRDLLDEAVRRENEIDSGKVALLDDSEFWRGMPRWRQRQRSLPVAEKIELIGKFILETRQLERIKKSCKPFAIS